MSSKDAITEYPGVLSMLLVDDGSIVEAGERIADVELMKTMFAVEAPASGVLRFRVKLGELVGEGDVIATISTE